MSILRRRRDKHPTAGSNPTPSASSSTPTTRYDLSLYDTGSSYGGSHNSSGCSSSSTSHDSGSSSSSCDSGGF